MANVTHASMSGSNLHENKGVSSASDDTVATATSAATVWKKLTHANLQTTGNPFGAQLFHVRDSAQLSLSVSSWQTRVLSTSVTNEITSASLASNQLSLPAGTYFIEAICNQHVGAASFNNSSGTPKCQARLRNITAGSDILYSNTAAGYYQLQNSVTGGMVYPTVCIIQGRFTLAGTTTLEIQTYADASVCQGPSEITSGIPIINTQVFIWKTA